MVPNPLLMDNHQAELGDHLARQNVLVGARLPACVLCRCRMACPAQARTASAAALWQWLAPRPVRRCCLHVPASGARSGAAPARRRKQTWCPWPQACAAPAELVAAIRRLDPSSFSKYEHGSPAGITRHIDQLVGLA